jgi:hypothetical protein
MLLFTLPDLSLTEMPRHRRRQPRGLRARALVM